MRSLVLWVDAALALLGLTMALCQAVVCILYGTVLGLSPTLKLQMPGLLASTMIFLVVGLLFLAGFLLLLRQKSWRWPMQGVAYLSLMPAGLGLYRLLA